MPNVIVTVQPRPGQRILLPNGLSTPHWLCTGVTVTEQDGGPILWAPIEEANTKQAAYVVTSGAHPFMVTYRYESGSMPYPNAMFVSTDSRYTRPADNMMAEALSMATCSDPAHDIANHVARQFDYGHPNQRFYEAFDHIPQICGVTRGSCVDINAYLIVMLRSAGVKAGYVTGAFFPAEKTNEDGKAQCDDMHCWVVTQDGFGERYWDIAHHLKLGTCNIAPALNAKAGRRFALAHSMGLSFPMLALDGVKLIAEPMWLSGEALEDAQIDIKLIP